MIQISGSIESDFLISTGILTRPRYNLSGRWESANAVAEVHLKAFKDLSEREPGLWSLAQGERAFLDLRSISKAQKGSAYQLLQAIPVPNENVPLTDLLDFKNRRRDELLALRIALETFIEKVEKAGDEETPIRKAVLEIENACIDAVKVSKETKFPLRLASIKTSYSIDFSKLIGPALVGLFANGFGMPTLQSVLIGAGAALINGSIFLRTEGEIGIKISHLKDHPFRYVSSFSKELFNK